MAHFAELNKNNIVLRVVVVDNANTSDINGNEVEELGILFLKKLYGPTTIWKQASYNGNIRVRYPYSGYSYNKNLDAFISPKPYKSWILNNEDADWISPLGKEPERTEEEIEAGSYYIWDEDLYQSNNQKGWILYTPNTITTSQ